MTLLWFILGAVLALGIARYNESSKLFWVLFTSFVIGIAGGSMIAKVTKPHRHSEENVIQMNSTQELVSVLDLFGLVTSTTETTPHNLVSRVEFGYNAIPNTITKCCVETRTQPPIMFDTS